MMLPSVAWWGWIIVAVCAVALLAGIVAFAVAWAETSSDDFFGPS